jgi:mannose-6-phosphate isomerase-like protein (cupin superfamily)
MAEIRQFGTEMSRPIPTQGVAGVQSAVIQLPAQIAGLLSQAELAERYGGVPLVVDRPVGVVALFFDADAHIHEHDADFPILFVVIGGSGFVRVGGPNAPSEPVQAGYATLWPAGVPHVAWTEDEPMQAISIEMMSQE